MSRFTTPELKPSWHEQFTKDWSDAARNASADQRARADKSAQNALQNLAKHGHTTIGHFEDDGNHFAVHVIDKEHPETIAGLHSPNPDSLHPAGRLAAEEPENVGKIKDDPNRYHVVTEFEKTHPGGPTWKDQGRFTQWRGGAPTVKGAVAQHVGEDGSMRSNAMLRHFGLGGK